MATASLTAAFTVLLLKLGGFISPASSDSVSLTVSNSAASQGVSPYRLVCHKQLALLELPEQTTIAPQRVFDPQGRIIACKSIPEGPPVAE